MIKVISGFGRGADTTRNPTLLEEGFARQSQNLLHNRGPDRAEVRKGSVRSYRDRSPASDTPVVGVHEYGDSSGALTPVCKCGTKIQKWTSGGTSKTDLRTITTTQTDLARFVNHLNFWVMADQTSGNYLGNATVAYPLGRAAPAFAPVLTSPNAGVLNGTYYYSLAFYSSITGELSPSYATGTSIAVVNKKVTVTPNVGDAASEQFDQYQLYRTKVGTTGPYYEVAKFNISALSYEDNATDASLTTLSTVHDSAGAVSTSLLEGATDLVLFRGRLFAAGLSGLRSRIRWSQLFKFEFDGTTDARKDVEKDDGDVVQRIFSAFGYLVVLKDHSVHLMAGDVDEDTFTWQVVSPKEAGVGAYCPGTAVLTPVGIFFGAQSGIYHYKPGMAEPVRISDRVQDTYDAADFTVRSTFAAGWYPQEKAYVISWTSTGVTGYLDQTWAYYVDTGAWSRYTFGGVQDASATGLAAITPRSYGLIHRSKVLTCAVGDAFGYVYEWGVGQVDGASAGTLAGTTTGGSSTTVVDSGAAFTTAGDGVLRVPVTVQHSGPTHESQLITAAAATQLTTNAFTTSPSSGKRYYVGAIEVILSLGRSDMGTGQDKFFKSITYEFQKQSHSVPMVVGYTLDGDAEPTISEAILQSGGFRISFPVERIGVGVAPYLRVVGNNAPLELLRIEVEYDHFLGDYQKS